MNRLQERYEKEIKGSLAKEFGIKNTFAVPKVEKVVVNMGIGNLSKNQQQMDALKKDLSVITGQTPSIRNAKVSIASFSLRAGMPVGLSATLRGERMYSFMDRLFSIVLPRLRDFRGVPSKSFDKTGNYTLGFDEHTVFPEIDSTKSASAHGFEITIVTTAKNAEESKKLLELLGMPFEKN
ncbi:MAG: 50S ribosomal protein L5, large subunit ribosomal protein L5 [Microgenomates group bacterium GW2011_GWC1_41_20]|uniref:Large ribosomal subunit protein uL5 n=7 Tax=Candidatus Woeseibacteriota TaxID=1752722 RepID=A0A0G0RUK6_9BACT|nr:MAG: 50S ribosomal protein L5 [Candidatus Woesebacteria bacterium GW2011_GWB1_40_12]KKR56238.1 MAG: 50S ribosomal protein L5 [Candidatus Woesebacteria bacterium GW2011_GWF1_40_24]KKR90745.1 MAG: 50S ribosomal protein L5 [Candidatus Woesebacteria bacterium GW2011_GWD1_41_12]KKS00783.1 MAG: 50S ribosomal protein L5, large subunit ribosomal protein L5 [Microgenomates group bacterium GW2011_GWC1_41_20]KKS05778.1 MAG: 50S ribosomal protein L5 [Candidatus Woesebacteria bacterium GW2011_GWE1_41_24]